MEVNAQKFAIGEISVRIELTKLDITKMPSKNRHCLVYKVARGEVNNTDET